MDLKSLVDFLERSSILAFICVFVGSIKLLTALHSFSRFCRQHFMTTSFDLHKRYSGGWAVVTGASDGIGAEYARQLARLGFNICLVSRTQAKLEKVEAQIKELTKNAGDGAGVETRILTCDFSGANSVEFYEKLVERCADIDVSIVIVNAGIMTVGDFDKMPGDVAQTMIDVNSYHYAMTQRLFLDRLLVRAQAGKRCAMIGVSSSSWLRYFPKFTVYTATKAFATYLSMALQAELRQRTDMIDVHCFVPFGTATNIVDHSAM